MMELSDQDAVAGSSLVAGCITLIYSLRLENLGWMTGFEPAVFPSTGGRFAAKLHPPNN